LNNALIKKILGYKGDYEIPIEKKEPKKYISFMQNAIDDKILSKGFYLNLPGHDEIDDLYYGEEKDDETDKLFYLLYTKEKPLNRSFYDSLAMLCPGAVNFRRIYLNMNYLQQGNNDTAIAVDLMKNLINLTGKQIKNLYKTENFAKTLSLIVENNKVNLNVTESYIKVLLAAGYISDCIKYGTEFLKSNYSNETIRNCIFYAHYTQANKQYIPAIEELRKLTIPQIEIVQMISGALQSWESNEITERSKLLAYCKKEFPNEIKNINLWPLGPINSEEINKCSQKQIYTYISFLRRNPKLIDDINQANYIEYNYWKSKSTDEIVANQQTIINKEVAYEVILERGVYCIEEQARGSLDRALIKQGCIPELKKALILWPKGCNACKYLGDAYSYNGVGTTAQVWYNKAAQLGCDMRDRGISTKGRAIKTGKRGGKYYVNSKGNKTYIKR
jgi:hypothetical protein